MAHLNMVNYIVVHCADTYARMDIGAKEIDSWHKQRGWSKIGYHFVIRRDGTVEKGRETDEIGAHTLGHNYESIGICMVGGKADSGGPENNFLPVQFKALYKLIYSLLHMYPNAVIVGHRDLSPDKNNDGIIEKWEWVKTCPSFDVREWWNNYE